MHDLWGANFLLYWYVPDILVALIYLYRTYFK